jgi:hypothetical protein
MTLSQARRILDQAGITVVNNRPSFSSSRRGIHGGPTYRVYRPGDTFAQAQVMTLVQVRQLALAHT